jgi:hypothetical protein
MLLIAAPAATNWERIAVVTVWLAAWLDVPVVEVLLEVVELLDEVVDDVAAAVVVVDELLAASGELEQAANVMPAPKATAPSTTSLDLITPPDLRTFVRRGSLPQTSRQPGGPIRGIGPLGPVRVVIKRKLGRCSISEARCCGSLAG